MAATLDARIRLDSSQFSGGLNRAMRETNAAVGRMSAQFGSLKNVLAGGLVGSFAATFLGDMFAATMQAEKLQMALSATAGGALLGAKQLEQIRNLSAEIGLDVEAAAKSMIQLQSAGLSAADSMRLIKASFNAVATSGGGSEQFKSVAYGMQQVLSAGQFLQEDINIIRESLPTAAKLMQEAFGANRAEDLKKLNISTREFVERLTLAMEKLPQMGDTMEKQLGRIEAKWKALLADIGKKNTGVLSLGGDAIGKLLDLTMAARQVQFDFFEKLGGGDPEKRRQLESFATKFQELLKEIDARKAKELEDNAKMLEVAAKDAASKDKSIEKGRTLAKVFGKFNDILKDTAKSARELAFSLEFEESMRAYEYQQRVNALVKELAEVEKEKRAEQYNDFVGPTQGDGWVHPDEMKERERGDWQERVRKAGMNKSERKAERDSEREERRNIIKAADRKTREQMQEIKKNEREKSFENAKQGKWLNEEATRRKLKDANRKSAEEAVKGAAQTLTDIKDILNKLATA